MSQSSTADANAQDSRRDSSREVGSAASDHTLVQTNEAGTLPLPTEDIPAQPHTMDKANHLAHPLEDTQTVADRYGKTGALGAGIASAAAALDTNADYNRREGHLDLGYRGQAQSHVVQSSVPLAAPSQVGTDNTIAFKPKVFREPPNRLPLHPNTRYCERCEIVKPYRAHHCRHCGTCILGMDHHCPWIGQCCGARNHIYFVVFCFWSCVSRSSTHRRTMQCDSMLTLQCPSACSWLCLRYPLNRSHSPKRIT